MEMSRKPVSRVDSSNTHGYFARIYRVDIPRQWVGSRSFSDRIYGGAESAEGAAWQWVQIAEERLPIIPPKPVIRKATVHVRDEPDNLDMQYFDVYLPPIYGEKIWSKKFYFNERDPEERAAMEEEAAKLVARRNRECQALYAGQREKWQIEHARLKRELLRLWEEVKSLAV
jgi:hypothetical protein